jgi:hypothetical protein
MRSIGIVPSGSGYGLDPGAKAFEFFQQPKFN